MAYKITSNRLDCAKKQGDSLTDKELLDMGANVDALISGGHISSDMQKTPIVEEGATATWQS